MPTSVPGSRARRAASATAARRARPARRPHGFTIVELLVIIAVIALAAGAIALTLRDSESTRLAHDGERLAMLLESARAEARAAGLPVQWVPGAQGEGFRFVGLPASLPMPERWLDPAISAQVVGAASVVLGPDALLPPQRVLLRLGDRRLVVASDGLAGFAVATDEAAP